MERDQHTFKELSELIVGLPQRYKQKIVGIDGLNGSGKKTFTENLQKSLPNSFVIHAGDFLKIKSEQVSERSFAVNQNFDWDRLEQEIFVPLRYEEPISYHIYDYKKDVIGEKIVVPVDVLILVEGTYVIQNRFTEMYDFKIWIEVPESVRLTRILESQGEGEWRRWKEGGAIIENNYLEKEKQNIRADLIIDGNNFDFREGNYGIIKT
jgi:uridine kinase